MDEKNKSSGRYRMYIQFNTKDEAQRKCLNFLSICGYKKNQMLAIMVQEFLERYELDPDELSGDDIKKFVKSYPYIRQVKEKGNQYIPVPVPVQETYRQLEDKPAKVSPPKAERESESTAAADMKQKKEDQKPEIFAHSNDEDFEIDNKNADQVLSAFGL